MAETIPIEPMIGDTSVVSPTITPLAILADEQAQIPAESIAPYPFDDRSADVILRSSDRVLFYVYKSILIYSSQFFRGLFTIGQDPEVSGDQPSRSQSILDLSEHSDILKQVLHWCYPIPHTEPDTIETIESILVVAMKYDMAGVIFYMHRPLQNLDDPCAIPLFGLSCNVGFSDLAEDAAQMLRERHSLANISQNADWTTTVTYSIYTPKLVSIRAASFLRLLHFVRDGIKPSDFCQPEPNVVQPLDTYTPISVWFSDGDLIVRSEFDDSVEFKVHTQIISFSSSILKDKIQQSPDTPGGDDYTLELPEGSTVLSLLLMSCYPSDSLDSSTFDPFDIPLLIEAAEKYGVERAKIMCRKRLAELILTDPFRVYHVAVKCGWKDEARNAAVQLARLWIEEEYHPSMENLDAGLYYPLLKFCHEYRRILFSVRSSNSIPIPIDNASGSASFSQILSEYDRMWRHVGHQYVPDAASVLSLPGMPVLWANPLRSYPNSANLMQQLLCYQSIAEQLNNLQISWDDGHVFQHPVSRIVRKKGKKGKKLI